MASVRLPRRFFYAGRLYEIWEHPDHPFNWTSEHMQRYAGQGDWESLFNALVLAGGEGMGGATLKLMRCAAHHA